MPAVDIFSGSSLTFLGRATGFTGQGATTSVSGADGVLTVTSGGVTTLYAGDGNSTLKVFNATNPAAPTLLQSDFDRRHDPGRRNGLLAADASGPGREQRRDPGIRKSVLHHQRALAGRSHPLPTSPSPPPGRDRAGGLEQPVWDPKTGTFFISVPALAGANNPGGVSEINTSGDRPANDRFRHHGHHIVLAHRPRRSARAAT